MAPAFGTYARSLLGLPARSADANPDGGVAALGPLAVRSALLLRRDTSDQPDPEAGIVHPGQINNKFVFVVFGLIGVAFILTGIWFFFWAKNGGFFFKKDDWDDYKSTVLRRKGPNGTTLSGATTETDLGGGSVYKDIDDHGEATTVVSGTTGITGGVSDVVGRERKRKRREQKEREKERRREERRRERDEKRSNGGSEGRERSSRRKVAQDGNVVDEQAEAEAEEYLRNYRDEKPARVGGINRESDASTWDGSTNPTESSRGGYTESSVTSELMSNRERTPTHSPEKKSRKTGGGIRKVYSTADKRDSRETARIRAEAKKLQERGRAAASSSAAGVSSSRQHRRDFSWQRNNRVDEDRALVEAPPSYDDAQDDAHNDNNNNNTNFHRRQYNRDDDMESGVQSSWGGGSDVSTDLGTKSYHHVIPGLSSSSGVGSSVAGSDVRSDVRDYAEEKRKRRSNGYRRER